MNENGSLKVAIGRFLLFATCATATQALTLTTVSEPNNQTKVKQPLGSSEFHSLLCFIRGFCRFEAQTTGFEFGAA